jgi:SET domain-containing protein
MKYFISQTNVKGVSVFAKCLILKDEFIGEYYKHYPNEKFKKNIFGSYDRELGRYCNHSFTPNTYVIDTINKDGYNLYALNNIQPGEEVLVNYVKMEELANVPINTFYKPHFNEDKLIVKYKNLI